MHPEKRYLAYGRGQLKAFHHTFLSSAGKQRSLHAVPHLMFTSRTRLQFVCINTDRTCGTSWKNAHNWSQDLWSAKAEAYFHLPSTFKRGIVIKNYDSKNGETTNDVSFERRRAFPVSWSPVLEIDIRDLKLLRVECTETCVPRWCWIFYFREYW